MNQGKLEVVKQDMARVNLNILGISEPKRTGMGEFNSDDHYIYYYGQEPLRRNGVAIIVNKRVPNAVLGCSLKNDRMISVHFQGKPFNVMVIQDYAPTSNAEEAEWFYEDLQDLLEPTPKKDILFIMGDWRRDGKPLQYSCLDNPVNSRKNEGMEPKQKQYPAVDVTGDRSKVQCCKQQYCPGT